MKTKENITLFICEHCNKKYLNKKACEKHEINCVKNPENWRPCFKCEYFEKRESDVYFSQPYAPTDSIYKKTINFCNFKKCGLTPPLAKNNPYDLIDFENKEMPTECEFFKLK